MLHFRLTISPAQQQGLARKLQVAQKHGDVRTVKFILAVRAYAHYQTYEHAARVLALSVPQVARYVYLFLCYGERGVGFQKPRGRKAKLSAAQKQRLGHLLDQGPQACGFAGGCWRAPLIQQLIQQEFGVRYNVFYLAQLLRNLGFSFQKARFVSDHLNEAARQQWRRQVWPQVLRQAQQQQAWLLFGDEASFPQWGTLNYTWARRAHQPTLPTSGQRKGYKVLGLLDYFTGRFFYQTTSARLNSATYEAFLTAVLAQTTRPIILIQDGARYHTSAAMKAFFAQHAARLTVVQLPSYSPDFNPIERLWKRIKQEETHLVYFPTYEALTAKVDSALLHFAQRSAQVLELFALAA